MMYFILGMVMEGVAMVIITMPFVYPVVLAAGIDPIWFGIFIVMIVETALITPPVGVNLYIIQSVTGVKFSEVAVGVWPFVALLLVMVVVIWIFPQFVLWLPSLIAGG